MKITWGNLLLAFRKTYFSRIATRAALTLKLVFQPQASVFYILPSFIATKSNLDPISFSSLKSFNLSGSYFLMAQDSLSLGFNPMIWRSQPMINVYWYPGISASTIPHQSPFYNPTSMETLTSYIFVLFK